MRHNVADMHKTWKEQSPCSTALRYLQQQEPDLDLILWKADVSEAYRRMPMHPLWQIKQVVAVHSKCYVDRCNVFGGRASQRIWHAIMSLVIWMLP
jgi:hypothetical protein